MIAPTTPAASRSTRELPISSSQRTSSIAWAIEVRSLIARPTWIIWVSFTGIPSSWVIVAVSSSARSPSPAAIAFNASARSPRGVRDQPGKALRAASTARSTSTGEQPGIVAIVSSVVELTTGSGSAPAGSTHSPPMKILSREAMLAAVAMPSPPLIVVSTKATVWMDIADKRLLPIRYIPLMPDPQAKPIEPAPLEDRTPGELLRQARIRHELSQEQLAIRAGTAQSAIARIERDRTSPSIKTMTALFQAMEEDFVFGARPRDWGVDLTLNDETLGLAPTERVERGVGFSEVRPRLPGGEFRRGGRLRGW